MTKKVTKRLVTLLTVMALSITSSISAFAATPASSNEFASEGDVVTIIDPNAAVPFTYLAPPTFTFNNSNAGLGRTLSGRYMAFEITLTNCTCSYVKIALYIDDRYITSYNFGAGCVNSKIDWIDMGYNGNHKVKFNYFAKPNGGRATVKNVMYSWT